MNRRPMRLALIIAILVVVFAPAASAAKATKPCDSPDPILGIANCQQGGGQTTLPTPTPTPSTSASAAPSAETTPTAPRASTASEEWASDTGKSVGGVADQMKDAYQRSPSPSWQTTIIPYAFTWAIGMVIFAIAMIVTISRGSRDDPKSRAELREQALKLWLYYPLMMILPMILKWTVDTAAGVSEGLVAQSGGSFAQFLDGFSQKMDADPLSFVLGGLGGAVAGLLLLLPTLGAMLMWLIFDITSRVGVQLLMLLVPITGALSLFPGAARRWSARAVGFLLGCILTPVVTRFTFWVMWLIAKDQVTDSANMLHSLLTILVVLFMCTASPIMLAYVMPMLLPQAGAVYGGGGGSTARSAQDLLDQASNGVENMAQKFRGNQAMSKGAAQAAGKEAVTEASAAKAAGGGAASTSSGAASASSGGAAAATKAGAVLGPVGLGLAALAVGAQKVGEMVESASKNAASQQLQGGGGGASAADHAPSVLPRSRPNARGFASRGRGPDAAIQADAVIQADAAAPEDTAAFEQDSPSQSYFDDPASEEMDYLGVPEGNYSTVEAPAPDWYEEPSHGHHHTAAGPYQPAEQPHQHPVDQPAGHGGGRPVGRPSLPAPRRVRIDPPVVNDWETRRSPMGTEPPPPLPSNDSK